MNTKAVADALAARFVGVSVTLASGVEVPGYGPSADFPNNIATSALLVYPPTGSLELLMRKRMDRLDYPIKYLRDPISMPGRSTALLAWYDAMRDRVEMQMTLGLAYVAWAHPISMRMEIDGEPYSQPQGGYGRYDVVELIVQVQFDEVVTTLGA